MFGVEHLYITCECGIMLTTKDAEKEQTGQYKGQKRLSNNATMVHLFTKHSKYKHNYSFFMIDPIAVCLVATKGRVEGRSLLN